MPAVQLFVEGDNLGALDIDATGPRTFTDHDETIAMLLAVHAAVAMKASSTATGLRTALDSRDLIGQTEGILVYRYRISSVQAVDLLIGASQNTNSTLRDVADRLPATGDLPTR